LLGSKDIDMHGLTRELADRNAPHYDDPARDAWPGVTKPVANPHFE
jgi:hypothetical protein